ncbi:RNA polymerase, sigma subunit, ECF family [Neorhodopirellula lusitana]|uniref:RNA polymerase, sigma subunit, ECF family n=1 Tax=Neorhodopirellula lusitana TaxID=445327 RepID=A0ABY1PQL5_9BACT|nr:sigma-70 family RNA polymerase sigma factor [Neorhodopirellula lusitana]SMP39732.1 RNA polymerase, sigma subunit, ECF family [Neorhodopirellula lusitana]
MKTRATSKSDLLLSRAKAGDAQAIEALFSLYQNYVRLLAASQLRAKLRTRVSASDVVQDTFMKAHRGFEEFRGKTGGEFVVWLRSILSRQIQTLYEQHVTVQSRDVRREVSLEEIGKWVDRSSTKLEAVLIGSDPSPGTKLQNHERMLRVADAIAQLSVDHREVLLLRSVEELGYKEIAERMQRSHGAVRMLWLRSIEALRDKLAEDNE